LGRDLPNRKELAEMCKEFEFNGEIFEADGIVYINDNIL
jgi:hypothetical protein